MLKDSRTARVLCWVFARMSRHLTAVCSGLQEQLMLPTPPNTPPAATLPDVAMPGLSLVSRWRPNALRAHGADAAWLTRLAHAPAGGGGAV
jgi:hypothetical protein